MKYFTILFCATLLFSQNLSAGFSNSGTFQSKNLQISTGGTLENDGELIGTESAVLSCETLSGKGLIRSPQISITTKTFAFKGTIDCSGTCTIVTATPFKKNMFKKIGKGEFIFIVDETLGATPEKSVRNFFTGEDLFVQVD